MSDPSFQDDVLNELGDDKLTEIAGLLGTDADGARDTVAATVGAMTGDLHHRAAADDDEGHEVRQAFAEVAEPPLQGATTLGGGPGSGGLMAGVLSKASKPVAEAVSKRTGIPAPTVTRVIEVLIPAVLAVFAKRAAAGRGAGAEAGAGAGAEAGA
ncbi:DUF937 domain-containing protein, partial [Streptomyces sp. ISL-86]|uniref:DUF937 domain-containing protein n=2 Tax=Streptomyces TaxID=1883 RepID=UPI001BEB7557